MKAQKTAFLPQKPTSGKLERATSCSAPKHSPKLRRHEATGQAYVVLNGKYIFFGPYGAPEVADQYSVNTYRRSILRAVEAAFTEVYAEHDQQKALEAIVQVG